MAARFVFLLISFVFWGISARWGHDLYRNPVARKLSTVFPPPRPVSISVVVDVTLPRVPSDAPPATSTIDGCQVAVMLGPDAVRRLQVDKAIVVEATVLR